MSVQVNFGLKGRNPDVLTCIANLSNDEVFTPPAFAGRMLDTLAEAWAADHKGESLWANPKVRFLDPCTKSGVFLREITSRLIKGLEAAYPDLQTRVDHILTKQVFGIAITKLTSLLARRSLYCSKHANGKHSVAKSFGENDAGNVWYERMEHTWENDRCAYCGANRTVYERGEERETHAYALIHADDVKTRMADLFRGIMQFDVIIGNPPYQLGDGAAGAVPIYHEFVRKAKALDPRYLTMVTPSRWFAGGNRLDEYRAEMLRDKRLRVIVDYPISSEVFPGVDVGGGISFFLWDASHSGPCAVTTVRAGIEKKVTRTLDAYDVFVRDAEAVSILEKVLAAEEPSMTSLVSKHAAFGLPTNFADYHESRRRGDLTLHYNGGGRMAVRKTAFISRSQFTRGSELVDTWKLFVSEAYRIAERFPNRIVGAPMIAGPGEVCTQTFLVIGGFSAREEAQSAASYYCTRFFRFLLWIRKIGQHASQSVYKWVPIQAWDRMWTDIDLYEKYGLSQDQVNYIESLIKPMDLSGATEDE
jgi:site-specific DNA-methyltransferase (adenine-specific)